MGNLDETSIFYQGSKATYQSLSNTTAGSEATMIGFAVNGFHPQTACWDHNHSNLPCITTANSSSTANKFTSNTINTINHASSNRTTTTTTSATPTTNNGKSMQDRIQQRVQNCRRQEQEKSRKRKNTFTFVPIPSRRRPFQQLQQHSQQKQQQLQLTCHSHEVECHHHIHYRNDDDHDDNNDYDDITTQMCEEDVLLLKNLIKDDVCTTATLISEDGDSSSCQNLFQQSTIPQLIVSPGGKVLECNQQCSDLCGFTESDDLSSFTVFNLVSSSLLPQMYEIFLSALGGTTGHDNRYENDSNDGDDNDEEFVQSSPTRSTTFSRSSSTTSTTSLVYVSQEEQGESPLKSGSSQDVTYTSVVFPCVSFASASLSYYIRLVLMNDDEPSKRCFLCLLTTDPDITTTQEQQKHHTTTMSSSSSYDPITPHAYTTGYSSSSPVPTSSNSNAGTTSTSSPTASSTIRTSCTKADKTKTEIGKLHLVSQKDLMEILLH